MPLLHSRSVKYSAHHLSASAALDTPEAPTPTVLLPALGPQTVRSAGELAGGVVTTWVTSRDLASEIVPRVSEAAAFGGRPRPRMASIVLGVATNEPDQVRQAVAERAGAASGLPAYRALLDRQGFGGVHETVLAGDEDDVAAGIRAYADAAASDVLVSIVGEGDDFTRTLSLLAEARPAGAEWMARQVPRQ